jgi:hypothetical protein
MGLDKDTVLRDIDDALQTFNSVRQHSQFNDLSDRDHSERFAVAARLISTALRLSPPGSHYMTQTLAFQEQSRQNPMMALRGMPGVLQALRADVVNGRIASVVELVHADVFGDFLDMAKHLLDQGFKDAAAVIAGSSLEAHLRAMCAKAAIETSDKDGKPKKASALNAELDKSHAYNSSGDPKSVTAWLDTRNDAAHGDYSKYLPQQVNLMIAGVRDFMVRYPA